MAERRKITWDDITELMATEFMGYGRGESHGCDFWTFGEEPHVLVEDFQPLSDPETEEEIRIKLERDGWDTDLSTRADSVTARVNRKLEGVERMGECRLASTGGVARRLALCCAVLRAIGALDAEDDVAAYDIVAM